MWLSDYARIRIHNIYQWAVCLRLIDWSISLELKGTQGMQVTSTGPQTIQKAEGESVTLGCSYTPSPFDSGELDIEWSVVSPDTTQKDLMVRSRVGVVHVIL